MPSAWRASSSGAAGRVNGAAPLAPCGLADRSRRRRSHFPCAGKGRKRAQLSDGEFRMTDPARLVAARRPCSAARAFSAAYVVGALAKRDYRIRVAVRRPELAGRPAALRHASARSQAVQANLRYRDSVARAVRGADGGRQPRRHPAGERPPDLRGRPGGGRRGRRGGGGRRGRASSTSRRSAPIPRSASAYARTQGRGRGGRAAGASGRGDLAALA